MPDMPNELDNTDSDAAERINDALDAIAQGASPAAHLHYLDNATARTIEQFQELSSHAGAPVPADAFVNQLREDLMLTSSAAPPAGVAKPKLRVTKSGAIQRRSEMPSRRGAFETAAAVLLVCALMFGAFAAGEGPRVLNFVGMTSQETTNEAIMWGGDPGRTWNLSGVDPQYGDVPEQVASLTNLAATTALIVGDDLLVAGADRHPRRARCCS